MFTIQVWKAYQIHAMQVHDNFMQHTRHNYALYCKQGYYNICRAYDNSQSCHQTFSGHIKHLSGETKFVQTNLLYNGNFIEFAEDNECPDNFQSSS